ncbi:hypothetical protein BEP19_00810 [Ammoniphilus oxalaticus]|uniref:Helicase XPB/Ssl2 N-terminal domain-containing protein n=1 Tax=Ammoniphilus oxalaticus TaxID=66863 RepID=A0A419SMJ6_9BACL|nr:helicase-associated domain-containing protein [Ammoniphilus oxalaticus]RKD25518.1 hypothetical protein BEP19_00810 [Ammoniphilus oxalaticus]
MKFAEVLKQLSERVIQSICHHHQQTDTTLHFLLDSDWNNAYWAKMSEDERIVIEYFLREKGNDLLTYREIEQASLPLGAVRFRIALTKLRRAGLIFTLRRLWGEQAYVMSEEQIDLFRRKSVSISTEWKSKQRLSGHLSYHILDDLLQVLNVVRKTAIGFSKRGTLHKRTVSALFHGTNITEQLLAPFADELEQQYPFALHEAIALDLLVEQGLLQKQGENVVIGAVDEWVIGKDAELSRWLLAELLKKAKFEPNLEMFYTLIQRLDSDETYRLDAILDSMNSFGPDRQTALEKCIQPLTALGLMESNIEEGVTLFKWRTYRDHEAIPLYIQPNFELMVPAFAPFRLKWKLLQIAELQTSEEMWVFKMSKESVQAAFESGKTAVQLIAWLQQVSAVPIPENVRSAVEQWEQSVVQASFWDVRLLRLTDATLATELKQIEPIASLLYEQIGERDFIVRVENAALLGEELEKRGYAIGPIVNLLEQPTLSDRVTADPILPLFKNKVVELDYQVESVFPDLDDALPGLRDLPRMWLSNYAHYHGSTLRKLIQQAIDLGLELKLEADGNDHRLQPARLTNQHGFWKLVARKEDKAEAEYGLEEIGRIQIISPL